MTSKRTLRRQESRMYWARVDLLVLRRAVACAVGMSWPGADLAPRSKSSTFAIALVIVERNPGVRLEARFALAAEHPDHDAYERNDKDKKVDCLSHVYSPRDRPAVRMSDWNHQLGRRPG